MQERHRQKKAYRRYSFITTLIQEAAVAAAALLLLPRFGTNIPVWFLVTVMATLAAYAYLSFRVVEKVMGQPPVVGIETLIGRKCRTVEALFPNGYVRVGPELWRAHSIAGTISPGTEAVITDVKGLTLDVRPLVDMRDTDIHEAEQSEAH